MGKFRKHTLEEKRKRSKARNQRKRARKYRRESASESYCTGNSQRVEKKFCSFALAPATPLIPVNEARNAVLGHTLTKSESHFRPCTVRRTEERNDRMQKPTNQMGTEQGPHKQ